MQIEHAEQGLPVGKGDNILRRNGGFELWQRGAGGSASFALAGASGSTYTADGWYCFVQANEASVVSQVAGLTDQSQFALKYQRNAGQTGTLQAGIGFPLDTDEIYPLLGKLVRVSFLIKTGANWSPNAYFALGISAGTGAPTKLFGGAGFTGTITPLNLFLHALSLGSTTRLQAVSPAVIPITTRQLELVISWLPVGTAGADDSFIIDDVHLEVVDNVNQPASPFQRRTFAEELALCQRHYFKSMQYATGPGIGTPPALGAAQAAAVLAGAVAKACTVQMYYPTPLRAVPTVTFFNPSSSGSTAEMRDLTAAADMSATALANNSTNSCAAWATGNAATAVGDRCAVHVVADAGI